MSDNEEMAMNLHGIHHVTAVTGDAPANVEFYTRLLGLRLVKKSVNQDDVSAYHLFYADKLGSPGTDMTFFDWPQTPPDQPGTDSIARTWFRVNGRTTLEYWIDRFEQANVRHRGLETFAERTLVRFEDPEGQPLALADDHGAPFEGEIWDGADIPPQYAIRGFYGVTLSVPRMAQVGETLVRLLGMEATASHPALENEHDRLTIFSMDGGGPGREVYVLEQPNERPARLGRGGVHHVAFRLRDDEEQRIWLDRLNRAGVRHSGIVDRYYFKSLYFRISVGILFELATDGPGFTADEPLESLGERLALPPFLEPHRQEIEAGLRPLPTPSTR